MIGDNIVEALGCDAFFKMVKEGATHWKKLLKLSTIIMKEVGAEKTTAALKNLSLMEVGRRLLLVARCFTMLLDPECSDSELGHLMDVRNYSGELLFEQTLKSSLASASFWNAITDDILKTASASKQFAAEVQELRLQATSGDEVTMDALKTIQQLRKAVRRGSLDKVDGWVVGKLREYCTVLLNGKATNPAVTMELLVYGCSMYESKDGVLDMLARVKKWQASNGHVVHAVELQGLLVNLSTCSLETLTAFTTKVLKKGDLGEELSLSMRRLVPRMLECLKDEVGPGPWDLVATR